VEVWSDKECLGANNHFGLDLFLLSWSIPERTFRTWI